MTTQHPQHARHPDHLLHRSASHLTVLLAGALMTLGVASSAHAALVYAIADLTGNNYQFGSFNLDTPTGSPGSYSYAWTSIGGPSSTALKDLARNPVSGDLFVNYGFGSYRAIGTDGTIGPELGTLPSLFGLALDGSGGMNGVYGGNWYTLDPADGATLATATLSYSSYYSAFGGNLTWSSDGDFYYAQPFGPPAGLNRITSGGSDTHVGAFSGGAGFSGSDWLTLFSDEDTTYLLNADRLYTVDLATAALTRLGTITNLPTDFESGFTGAAGMPTVSQAPAPATLPLLAGGLALVRWTRRRRRGAAA